MADRSSTSERDTQRGAGSSIHPDTDPDPTSSVRSSIDVTVELPPDSDRDSGESTLLSAPAPVSQTQVNERLTYLEREVSRLKGRVDSLVAAGREVPPRPEPEPEPGQRQAPWLVVGWFVLAFLFAGYLFFRK